MFGKSSRRNVWRSTARWRTPDPLSLGERLAGWTLLSAILYAPWAMGCIPPKFILGLEWLLGGAFALWAAGRSWNRRLPNLPWPLVTVTLLLLGQGWWMTWNARLQYDPSARQFIPPSLPPWMASLPGAVDAVTSAEEMRKLTALAAALWVATDLARDAAWRRRLWGALAVGGVSIACWGLLQRAGLTPAFIINRQFPNSPFATFGYHGNAGAFLNLALPAAFGLAFAVRRRWGLAIVATPAALAVLSAALVNISRAGVFIALLLCAAFGCLAIWRSATARFQTARSGVAALLLVGVLSFAVQGCASYERFSKIASQMPHNARYLAWKIAWGIHGDHPYFGEGPGAFKLLLPITPHFDRAIYSRWIITYHTPGQEIVMWSQAHNDYLQCLVEWGWVGLAVGLILPVGAAISGAKYLRRNGTQSLDRVIVTTSLLAGAGVLLHAAYDFPLQVASIQFYTVVYLALLWSAPRWRDVVEQPAVTMGPLPLALGCQETTRPPR